MDTDLFDMEEEVEVSQDDYKRLRDTVEDPDNNIDFVVTEEFLQRKKEEYLEQQRQDKLKAKRDEEYRQYSLGIENFIKWMIGVSLFSIGAVGYFLYKDYFFLTFQGGITVSGETQSLGKAIIEVIFSLFICFLAPALLAIFVIDKED
jgi:hypothetical protein